MPAAAWRRIAVVAGLWLGGAATAGAQLRALEVQLDNDQFAFISHDDERWYTSGAFVRLAYDAVPDSIESRIGQAWCRRVIACEPGARTMHVFSIGHVMYTPAYPRTPFPQPWDRPYAATLRAGFATVVHGERSRQTLELQLGTVGPAALGERVQNTIHALLGQPQVRGWGWQVRAQPVFQLAASRLHAQPLGSGADAVLRGSVMLGNPVTEAGVGAMLRVGRLPAGPTWPGESIGTARASGWHAFGGVEARAVARDRLIDGSTYGYASPVTREPVVGTAFVGASFAAGADWHVDLSWALHAVPFSVPGIASDGLRPQRVGTVALRWQPPR